MGAESDVIDVPKLLKRLNIQAERAGKEWVARCPNPKHDDKDPSWRIKDDGSDRTGKHHCWPCGLGGGPVTLVMVVLGIGAREAHEWLGTDAKYAEPVPSGVTMVVPSWRSFSLPDGVYLESLEKWPGPPREYAEERGITSAQVERWGMGWASTGKLAGRIVLPVRDERGRIQGYTSRTYAGQERRYREPDLEEGANRAVLFGEQHWPIATRRAASRIYVMEGGINALAVERAIADLDPTVAALSGSNFTATSALKLSSFGQVVVFRDNDPAGLRVAQKVEDAVGRHRPLLYVDFDPGKDPASTPPALLRSRIFDVIMRTV